MQRIDLFAALVICYGFAWAIAGFAHMLRARRIARICLEAHQFDPYHAEQATCPFCDNCETMKADL